MLTFLRHEMEWYCPGIATTAQMVNTALTAYHGGRTVPGDKPKVYVLTVRITIWKSS